MHSATAPRRNASVPSNRCIEVRTISLKSPRSAISWPRSASAPKVWMSFWVDGSIKVSMDDGSSLETGKREQCLAFVFSEHHVTGQPEHFEQLHCLRIYFGESELRAVFFRDVDDAEKYRDTDTVDELRVAEIDHQRAAAAIELAAALTFDLFSC